MGFSGKSIKIGSWLGWLLGLLVCAVLLERWRVFLPGADGLWNGVVHDRHGHMRYALQIAEAIRAGDAGQFIDVLHKGRTWPPLHGFLAAIALLFSHNDWHFAVLPSLAGWGMLLGTLGILAADCDLRRGGAGIAAGLTAMAFAISSPAHRAFATDVMLESLGAGLTACAALWFHRAKTTGNSRDWRLLAVTLTLLLVEKYNYWLIALVTVGCVCAAGNWKESIRKTREQLAAIRWLHPLNFVLLAIAGVLLAIVLAGPTKVAVGGRAISLYPPNNLLTLFWVLLLVRIGLGIRAAKWRPATEGARAMWNWHLIPVAVFFAIPQRLGAFLGFVSPQNAGDAPIRSLPDAAAFYLHAAWRDYHASPWLLVAAVVLAGFAWRRRDLPGIRFAAVCLLLGTLLTVVHPNQKSRFMLTWLPMLWMLAGAGTGVLLQWIPTARWQSISAGIVSAIALACAGPAAFQSGRSPETGHRREALSLLNVSRHWVDSVRRGEQTGVVATQRMDPWLEWPVLASTGREGLKRFRIFPGDSLSQHELAAWANAHSIDRLFVIDIPPHTPAFTQAGDRPDVRRALANVLATQTIFVRQEELAVPEYRFSVAIWGKAQDHKSARTAFSDH